MWIEAETLRVFSLVRLFSYFKITRARKGVWKQVARANPVTICARQLVNDCDVTALKNDCACSRSAFQNRSISGLFGAMRA